MRMRIGMAWQIGRKMKVIQMREGTERNPLPETANLEHLQIALMFIKDLQNASLDNGKLDPETLQRLRNPTSTASCYQ